MKKINFISLFSGGGGFQIGFEAAKFNCILSSDIDEDAEKTHYRNYQNIPFIKKDIRELSAKEILKSTKGIYPDLILGALLAKVFLLWEIKTLQIPETICLMLI